ncbi:MAG: AAA family ATPase [Bryobacterales bacterium]|nr:AAA family ATPase [Bryobacterales bacterium]
MQVRLNIEGIRCFSTLQQATIRPLTILVGENSAGKTTFLALCQIASAILEGYSPTISFNEPPFSLGAFEQIGSYMGGRAGRVREFSLGVEQIQEDHDNASVHAVFGSEAGQPIMKSWRYEWGSRGIRIQRSDDGGIRIEFRGKTKTFEIAVPKDRAHLVGRGSLSFLAVGYYSPRKDPQNLPDSDELQEMDQQLRQIRRAFGQFPYAFAPIRTNPRRTYDPTGAAPDPEGSHIPMLLARLASQTEPREWKTLRTSLQQFGANSGLFQQVDVIRKGKKESDPFQIGIKGSGPSVNLVDVGYGVSQVLPLVVDSLQRLRVNDLFLLQQPEVHLHPRAQAELGSFFGRVANRTRRFVVETHSDYLVDRVRMEVRSSKRIRPEDVSLLYFERGKEGARIHNIELDAAGSIVNPPPGYRQFFLDEELALLGD